MYTLSIPYVPFSDQSEDLRTLWSSHAGNLEKARKQMLEQQQTTLALQRQASQQKHSGKPPALASHRPGLPAGSSSALNTRASTSSQQRFGSKKAPAHLGTKLLLPTSSVASRDEGVAVGAVKCMPKGGVRASTTSGPAQAAVTGGMSWNPVRLMSPFETSGSQAAGQAPGAKLIKVNDHFLPPSWSFAACFKQST